MANSTHQAQVPAVAALFFGCGPSPYIQDHPIITAVFTPATGWKRTGFNKRVSPSWARKLRAEGVTHVTLLAKGRSADFRIEELTK